MIEDHAEGLSKRSQCHSPGKARAFAVNHSSERPYWHERVVILTDSLPQCVLADWNVKKLRLLSLKSY